MHYIGLGLHGIHGVHRGVRGFHVTIHLVPEIDLTSVPRRTVLAQSRSFASIMFLSLECTFSFCTLYFSFRQSLIFPCLSQNLFFPWDLHAGTASAQTIGPCRAFFVQK